VAYLAVLVVIGAVAFHNGDGAVRLVFGILFAGAVVSFALPIFNLRGLAVIRNAPDDAHAGEYFHVAARIRAVDRVRSSFGVVLEDGPEGPYAKPGRAIALRVAPGEPADVRYRVRIRDRGRQRITECLLSTRFPFGLFEHRVRHEVESEIVVFPRLGRFRRDPLPAAGFSRLMTATETAHEKGQEEFRNLREYRPGDSPRLISWKATARHRELMVKELEDDLTKRVTIFLESRLEPGGRRSQRLRLERAISFAATLIRRLARRKYQIRLFYYGPEPMEVATDRRQRQLERIMRCLAELTPTTVGGIHHLVSLAPDEVFTTSRAVIVVPAMSRERLAAALERMPARHSPVVYRANGAWERSLFTFHEEEKIN
jgi:uncharacterized protein (DUF58 family)